MTADACNTTLMSVITGSFVPDAGTTMVYFSLQRVIVQVRAVGRTRGQMHSEERLRLRCAQFAFQTGLAGSVHISARLL